MEEFATRVRYIWSEADVEAVFPYVAARHAQIKLRAYDATVGLNPRVRHLPTVEQFEVEFTVHALGGFPQQEVIDACSEIVLRNVAPWAKRETIWRIETETRPVSLGVVLGDAR